MSLKIQYLPYDCLYFFTNHAPPASTGPTRVNDELDGQFVYLDIHFGIIKRWPFLVGLGDMDKKYNTLTKHVGNNTVRIIGILRDIKTQGISPKQPFVM